MASNSPPSRCSYRPVLLDFMVQRHRPEDRL